MKESYERELRKQMKLNWSFKRWVRESQSYMAHKPKWWIAIRATLKWPKFKRQMIKDAEMLARAKSVESPHVQ